MSKVAKAEFDNATGKWVVSYEGKTLVKVAKASWISRNFENSSKVRKAGVTHWEFAEGQSPKKVNISSPKSVKTVVEVVEQSRFEINKRFDFMSKMIKMVRSGKMASMIITGEGGIGKSYSVLEEIEDMEHGRDYLIIKGFSTAKALFRLLQENYDKLIIFDDCDSVLKDPVSVNLLKSALDSYNTRWITWNAESNDDLERSFEFKGRVMFISNLPSRKMDGAILSRSMVVDLTMTTEDKIARMWKIMPNMIPEVSMAHKTDALNWIEAHKDEIKELNFRTLIKVAKIREDDDDKVDWTEMADFMTIGG